MLPLKFVADTGLARTNVFDTSSRNHSLSQHNLRLMMLSRIMLVVVRSCRIVQEHPPRTRGTALERSGAVRTCCFYGTGAVAVTLVEQLDSLIAV